LRPDGFTQAPPERQEVAVWRFLRNPNGQGAICNGTLAVLAALDGAPCAAGVTAVMAWLDVAAYRRGRA
jgi:hypothetical protein